MIKFKTESKKLLDLMINSIYTNKDIFLRELISNASDALDKLAFASLTDPSIKVDSSNAAITIDFDKDARTITIHDNGIGMTREELDTNLGTIAHSGSEQFKQQQNSSTSAAQKSDDTADNIADNAAQSSAQKPVDIIGQFGVGFYSAFMVAKRVRVISRSMSETCAYEWESNGIDGYEIKESSSRPEPADHGSDVILYLKDNTEEDNTDHFLSEWTLQELIREYSNYIHHPIKMMVTKSRELPRPKDAGDDYKPQYEQYQELETINSMTPIWKKRASDVEEKDYNEFYKSTFHDWNDPLSVLSFHAEGSLSYDALLFIPSQAPFDLYSKDYEKGLALYSSNVLIQDKCAELLPDYYNFVRGVVDSCDISLNISRETLQKNAQLHAIARRIEKKVHGELLRMLNDKRSDYEKFFEHFGRGLKFGIYSSYGAKAQDLSQLLLFWSARDKKLITLAEYAEHMPKDQDKIYYAAGSSRERIAQLPMVTAALSHGFDVLLCTQDVDEFMFQVWRNYEAAAHVQDGETSEKATRELAFTNVSAAGLDFATKEEKEKAQKTQEEHKGVFEALKDALESKVNDVRVSAELGDFPARISAEGNVSLEMERVLEQSPDAAHAPRAQRILEINPEHPVFKKLVDACASEDKDKLKLYANVLLDQALLVEGLTIEDPIMFAKHICELM